MTVEQRSDDTATQHTLKRFVFAAWLPLGCNLVAVGKTANVQTLRIGWTATKTREVRSKRFLNTFCRHAFVAFARNDWRNLNRCTLPVAV